MTFVTPRTPSAGARVAGTLADLDGSAMIDEGHLDEAVQCRRLDRRFYGTRPKQVSF